MALIAKMRWKRSSPSSTSRAGSFMFDCGWGVDPPVASVPLA